MSYFYYWNLKSYIIKKVETRKSKRQKEYKKQAEELFFVVVVLIFSFSRLFDQKATLMICHSFISDIVHDTSGKDINLNLLIHLQINALCMAFYARSEEARQTHSVHKLALVKYNALLLLKSSFFFSSFSLF